MTVRTHYEISSEGAVRHWEISYARLENVTPTATQPFAAVSLLPGTQLCGTVLVADASTSRIVGDVTPGMVYAHKVRNVRTYAAGAEATWGVINEGDPIYYDGSATMPADVFLSTSPLDNAGVANPLFGYAVLAEGIEAAVAEALPTTVAGANTDTIPVMQRGAGA